MTDKNFYKRCKALFEQHGRGWINTCCKALNISRASFYRFKNNNNPSSKILIRLAEIEKQDKAPYVLMHERDLLSNLVQGLMIIQDQIDEQGYPTYPYPDTLHRAFDIGAAKKLEKFHSGINEKTPPVYPTNLSELTALAQEPLITWMSMDWDDEENYWDVRLLESGNISEACYFLKKDGDPEAERIQHKGYKTLITIARTRSKKIHRQIIYESWRRLVIEHPVITEGIMSIATTDPFQEFLQLLTVDELTTLNNLFYTTVPKAASYKGKICLCKKSGTILIPGDQTGDQKGFITEYEDPEACNLAREGQANEIPYTENMRQVLRVFRNYWVYPGILELELEKELNRLGWKVQMWPELDTVDLLVTSPEGFRIAIDAKTVKYPKILAMNFKGFGHIEADLKCIVIPHYLKQAYPEYIQHFMLFREQHNLPGIIIKTDTDLLNFARTQK